MFNYAFQTSNTDVKFQFNENTCQAQCKHETTHYLEKNGFLDERLSEANRLHSKTPSADSVGMAFSARTKLNQNPERQMIGLS